MNQDKTKWMRFNKEVMPGGCAVTSGGCGAEELLTVTVVRDEHGYGMKVSGDNPVYVQSVKEHGAAWRAGLRAGDRILRVDGAPVHDQAHQTVVHMIRANPTAVLTVQPNAHRHITAPLPVNQEKQRQVEFTKVKTVQLMLDNERKYIWDLKNELSKVPDVRKQAQLELAEQRCSKLQQEIENMKASQSCQDVSCDAPRALRADAASPAGFLSGLPRSLSNLTGQSLRNLRHARHAASRAQQPPPAVPPLVRQKSDEGKRRHNNTVPLVPTTCLDNASPPPPPPPPPLPPRREHQPPPPPPPASRRSQEPERDELRPNSISVQMSYPLVNVSPPPLQTDNRTSIPVLHARSHSSPEQLDTAQPAYTAHLSEEKEVTPPPGTPPPPYAHNTQPCADPQRAIISMEEDDSTASDTSTSLGLFSNLKEVKESRARMAVLLNWLLGERRCACSCLFLLITDGYRTAASVSNATLRRWAYEIQSTFLMPNAVLAITSVDENIANEIEQVLANDYDKDEILRNVFRKARHKAKEELSQHLTEFQRKRQVGLGTLYGPEDSVLLRCDADKAQELVVVERLVCGGVRAVAGGAARGCSSHGAPGPDAHAALLAALVAAAHCLQARPHTIAAAAGGGRASFLLRDKHYKQRLKQLAKQPTIVRGHHLSLQAMTAASDCHHCDNVIGGLAPQAYVCTDCKLRVHRTCARIVEEPCCIDGSDQPKRISRFMERIQHNANANNAGQDTNEKKSRKSSATTHFLNMERSFRKNEEEQPWEQMVTTNNVQGESRREGSSEEPAPDVDPDAPDAKDPDKDSSWRHLSAGGGRGVNRAESCRERGGSAAHVRRGKQRNASDPNRLTADQAHNDLESSAGGAGGASGAAPSGSSSSSSLSSRSNESNTAASANQAWQSEWSEEEEPLAAAWADTVPAPVLDALGLSPRHRKRQEVIHELIVSEGSHVRWLRVLGRVFLRPLERGEHAHLLAPDDLRALFPNLPQVLDRHVRLYTALRQLRVGPDAEHAVRLRPLADAVLQTLGEPGYAACVSRFCRGQRMALEALRERRRKSKELHQFLAAREQDPLCGRLQLRDLVACVWQRLTKYQLLLENILRTVVDEDEDSEEDVARLRLALDTAKEVLHSVDTAIRTAENDHRLRTIQNKLEVRVSSSVGGEFEELRRFELTRHSLRMEGELMIRTDTNKRAPVLALMLEDCLVLLQREGDRFLLKPIPQPSQSGLLSPIVRWSTVLFRPNAAVRNAFFLMNLNGVQMHELSANTPAEYSMWCKYIQEAPLADARTGPHHAPVPRTLDDNNSSTSVTRNPSDASERSGSAPAEGADASVAERPESAAADAAPASAGPPATPAPPATPVPITPQTPDAEKKLIPRRPTVGRISTHGPSLTAPLEPSAALTVHAPAAHAHAHTAARAYTAQAYIAAWDACAERLRRLDAAVGRALRAKSRLVGELLAVPGDARAASAVAELAVADALGQLDVNREMRLTAAEGSEEVEGAEGESDNEAPDVHQLLLAAQAQANYLTMALTRALSVSEADVVSARGGARGSCDSCARRRTLRRSSTLNAEDVAPAPSQTPTLAEAVNSSVDVPHKTPRTGVELNDSTPSAASPAGAWTVLPPAESSYDTLPELGLDDVDDMALGYNDLDDTSEEPLLGCGGLPEPEGGGAAVLASRLVGAACGLQATLGRLLAALPALDAGARAARAHLAQQRDANDALRARLLHERTSRDSSAPLDADDDPQERSSSGG